MVAPNENIWRYQFDGDDKHWNRAKSDSSGSHKSDDRGHSILVADLAQDNANRLNNADHGSIDLIWNQVLVQSQGASDDLPFTNDLTFCGQDPKFQRQGPKSKFTVPSGCASAWLSGKTLEINLQPEPMN